MSRYVEVLAYVQVALSVGFQGAIIGLQVGAFRRHHHISFALWAVSTACGVAYLLVAVAPHVLHTGLGATAVLYSGGFLLFLGQGFTWFTRNHFIVPCVPQTRRGSRPNHLTNRCSEPLAVPMLRTSL
jgi:hypothetical protein